MQLMFKEPQFFLGRNGYFKAIGVDIDKGKLNTTLRPITSKRKLGRAALEIPTSQIDELIKILKTEPK